MNTDTVRYQPWALLSELQGNLNQFFDQKRQSLENRNNSDAVVSEWLPAVDIKEEADRFVLFADLPGIDAQAIDITMENGILTIAGERTLPARTNDHDYHDYSRIERAYGRFHRRFSLPDSADPDAIQARDEHGVLIISIPKQERTRPRRIEVKH